MGTATFYVYLYLLDSIHPDARDKCHWILQQKTDQKKWEVYESIGLKTDNKAFLKAKYSKEELDKYKRSLVKQKEIATILGFKRTLTVYDKDGIEVPFTKLSKYLNK